MKYLWALLPALVACGADERMSYQLAGDAGIEEASFALSPVPNETSNMFRIHTCDHPRARTTHPITATLRFRDASYVLQSRAFALEGAGSEINGWKQFNLGSSGLPNDVERWESLTIAKVGSNDAWCIDQVEIIHGGVLRWHFDALDERPELYADERPAGVLWLDDAGAAYAPTSSILFSDQQVFDPEASYVGLPFRRSPGWAPTASEVRAKVMSFNTRWGACLTRRYRGQAKMIGDLNPDIVGLQEPRSTRVTIGNKEGKFIDLYREELRLWGPYEVAADPIMTPDNRKEMNDQVPIFFREDLFLKVHSGGEARANAAGCPEEGENTPDERDDKPAVAARADLFPVRWVRLKHRATGRELVVYNAHTSVRSCLEREQMKDLASFMADKPYRADGESKDVTLPVLLVGDFNLRPDNAANVHTFNSFLWKGLASALPRSEKTFFRQDSEDKATYVWGEPDSGMMLDHIFVDFPRLETLSTSVHRARDGERAYPVWRLKHLTCMIAPENCDRVDVTDSCNVQSSSFDAIDRIAASEEEQLGFFHSDHVPIMATVRLRQL